MVVKKFSAPTQKSMEIIMCSLQDHIEREIRERLRLESETEDE